MHVAAFLRLALVAAVTLQVRFGCARSLHQATHPSVHGDHVHFGELNPLKSRLDYDHTINPLELRGTWFGDADQYSANVYDIFDNATALPDCNDHPNEFNYEHYSPDDPHFMTLSGDTTTNISRTTASHRVTTQTLVVNYTDNIMYIYNPSTGVSTCSHFKPYVDLATGLLKAEILNINMYSLNATGYRESTSMNCEVQGNEIPGCYTEDIARGPGLIGTKSYISSPSAAPPLSVSAFSVPDGGVLSVNRITYTCMNGECLTMAPKFADNEHTH